MLNRVQLSQMYLLQHSPVSLFRDGQSDSLRTWQRHHRFAALTNQENVRQSRGKQISCGIFDMHDVVRGGVSFFMSYNSHTPCVAPSRYHYCISRVVFDDFCDLSSGDVDDNRVVHFSLGTWSSNRPGVMCHQVRDGSSTRGNLLYFAQLVSSFISSDTVANKSYLHIVE